VHSARDYYLIHPNAKLYSRGAVQRANSLTCRIWSAVKRRQSKHVDGFISISHYVKDLHLGAGFFPRAKTATVYNPVTIAADTKHKLTGPWTYGYLGRLDESKGLELLMEAFARLDDDQSRLLIAGRGDVAYEVELKQRAGARITFLGKVTPAEFFPMIDCLVVPSHWAEPLGRSNAGGIPEIIDVGSTGLTFTSGSAAELEQCLVDICRLPKTQAIADCEVMAQRFSGDTIVKSYAAFYERVIEQYAVL
jgi:glycogen(starch) synthase